MNPPSAACSGSHSPTGSTFSSPDLDPYRIYLFRFSGSGGSYFRIWIVNLLLSILTLGIYSAWAKVRREQYFHRNLQLDGASFDYHGSPKAILKGRALVFGVLLLVSVLDKINPTAATLVNLMIWPAIPWFIVRAMKFRAANTSYRGVRFAFTGTYREVGLIFLKYGLLTLLTVGLAFPVLYGRLNAYCIGRLQYGQARWHSQVAAWDCVVCMGPGLALVLAYAALGWILLVSPTMTSEFIARPPFVMGFLLVLSVWLFMVAMPALFIAKLGRLVLNNSGIAAGHFISELAAGCYLWLRTRNWLLTLLTLGLYLPYARVVMAQYRAEKLAFVYPGALDTFIAQAQADGAALGDEAGEALGLDLAL